MKAKKTVIDRDKLYSSSEVRKLLGISSSTLSTLVERGTIEKVTPPGYKQGFYTKNSVDEYRKQREIFDDIYTAKQSRRLIVKKASKDDQSGIFEMEKEVLGATVPLERRLERQALTALLKGEIRGWEVPAEDVETYEPGKQYNLFIMALAVRKTEGRPNSMYAALLLREVQDFLYEIADKEILIKAIYATSRTRDGIYLAERFNMETIKEWSTPHRKCFVMDMSKSSAKMAKAYREHVASLRLSKELTAGILP